MSWLSRKSNDRFNGIEIGDRARDVVTGFAGLVTARVEYTAGCNQVLLTPHVNDSGDFREAHWFDVEQIEITERSAAELKAHPSGRRRPSPRLRRR